MEKRESKEDESKSSLISATLQAKLLYLMCFAANASLIPYLPVYYSHLGMSSLQAGLLVSVWFIIKFIGQPIWGIIADKTGKRKLVLITAILVSAILSLGLYPYSLLPRPRKHGLLLTCNRTSEGHETFTKSDEMGTNSHECQEKPLDGVLVYLTGDSWIKFCLLFIQVAILGFFAGAVAPIIDATAVAVVGRGEYGKVRMWGAVGVGAIGLVTGIAIAKSGFLGGPNSSTDFLPAFAILLILTLLLLGLCIKVDIAASSKTSATVLFSHLRHILSSFRSLLFITIVLLIGMGSGTINAFLYIFLADIGGSYVVIGISIGIMCTSEVIVFPLCGRLLEKIGPGGILLASLVCMVIRFLYYSFLYNPWLVLVVEPLHGFTFAAMWVACVAYSDIIAPFEVKTTILGLISGVYGGLGVGIGSIFGGIVYRYYGPRVLYRSSAVISSVAIVLLFVMMKQTKQEQNREEMENRDVECEEGEEVKSSCDGPQCCSTDQEQHNLSEKSRLLQ